MPAARQESARGLGNYLGVGLLLPRGVGELLLGPRGGPGVGAGVAAGGWRPEAAAREAADTPRGVSAPEGPRAGTVGRRRVLRASVAIPRGRRPRPTSTRGPAEAAPAPPAPSVRAGVRRSRGPKVLPVHLRDEDRT